MDSLDGGLDAVELLVGVGSDVHYFGVHVGLPSGIAVAVGHFCACETEERLDLTCYVPFARLDGRALRCGDEDAVFADHLD